MAESAAGSPPFRPGRPAPGPRRWAGREAGSWAAALPGSPGTVAGWPRHRPAGECALAEGAAGGERGARSAGSGARDPEPGRGRGSRLARQKVSREVAARAAGPPGAP